MKTIALTQGKVTRVDDDVYEWAKEFNWCAHKCDQTFYAVRSSFKRLGKRRTIHLHREILKAEKGIKVDHRDGDGLNNLRDNIRIATTQQNAMARQRARPGKSSKFRGVSWYARDQKWQASIEFNGKGFHLGHFTNEEDAARAYDFAAREKFKEFAQPNFI